ncbi:unnamed protein product [Rotaria socialis]|uniref:Uncharacterized protein n=1 Tax=Rotaria socialis TaxID=392032 RepID=A0A818AI77_9BILA|nr:unnamed protein product [Rotaria socialis]CAF4875918.1 unnamed protein product [Rotaria socialis]
MPLLIVLTTLQRHISTSKIAEEYLRNNNHFIFMRSLNDSLAPGIRYQVRAIGGHVHFNNCDRSSIVQLFECRFIIKLYFNLCHIIEQQNWKDEDWKAGIYLPSHHV